MKLLLFLNHPTLTIIRFLDLFFSYFFSDADASFTRQANFKLMGHKITQTTVRDEFICALYCLRYCSCQSFNLSKESHDQYTCELNKATDKQFPGDLIFMADDDITYYTMAF